jgi:hypothetical protein
MASDKKVAPAVHATRKRLRAAYNKGYNARKHYEKEQRGVNGFLAPARSASESVEATTKKTEVVLNIGSVRIQINTED